jgi:hypothetical protein
MTPKSRGRVKISQLKDFVIGGGWGLYYERNNISRIPDANGDVFMMVGGYLNRYVRRAPE